MRIMFWNTHNNDNINSIINRIILNYKIDIAVLAEYSDNIDRLVERLSVNYIDMMQYHNPGCDKIDIIGNITNVSPGFQDHHFSIQIINNNYILCAAHLPSQIYSGSDERRRIVIQNIIENIQTHEKKLNSKRTIIVGDMNEDPYDNGCLLSSNFFGIPSRNDAIKESKIIEGKSFEMFYNPMWNCFGDFSHPPGTCYYYNSSNPKNSFWHIFDQVMIRPCLVNDFIEKQLKIITTDGTNTLLDDQGHPNKSISDHLPIIFELKER